MQLVAKKPVRYAGRLYQAGQRFNARTTVDARVLVAAGLAEQAPPAPPPAALLRKPGRPPKRAVAEDPVAAWPFPTGAPHPAALESPPPEPQPAEPEMPAAQPETLAAEGEPKPRSRRYARRDLTAEGE
jgi:hypothetical protein